MKSMNNTILHFFHKQVNTTPEGVAVVFQNNTLTYRELDEKSNQLAHLLIARGVQPDTFLAICMDKSLEMIVAILATLKAGCAYVPIDPDYPADRIAYMLNDINAVVAIVSEERKALFINVTVGKTIEPISLNLSNPNELSDWPIDCPDLPISKDSVAYIIYTSGSTGRPKGVMVTHWNVVRLFFNETSLFDFHENDVWSMFHSFCFDFSVWEMYGALLFGGKVVVVPKQVAMDVNLFCQLMVDEGITILNQTPSAFYMLQDQLTLSPTKLPLSVRYLIFGGEALNPARLKPWKALYPNCRTINMYGITETTVHVTYQEITDVHLDSNASVIGKPIPTLYAYVLDEQMNRARPNTIGELYIGGEGLAKGYLNQPELTASRFINDPFSTEAAARLYRTGDLAKQSEDGTLEYHGRIDNQVKIRGFRIELGEIEHALQQVPNILHSVVVAQEKENGNTHLVGYYVTDEIVDKKAINDHLCRSLPDYMVPQFFVQIDTIPLTSNGKVDKKALPVPDASELQTNIYIATKHKTERIIADAWKTILQVARVGRHDHFFELGGNSLLAQKVVLLLQEDNIELPVIKLYQYPILQDIAAFVDGRKTSPDIKKSNSKASRDTKTGIALIGMAGRFPGVDTIEALWESLKEGRETITFFENDELDHSIPPVERNDPSYVKARGIISNADQFDAELFSINPTLAKLMDPQQRVFLEICREVLESAGYLTNVAQHAIGVYAGAGNNTYFTNNLQHHPDEIAKIGAFQVMLANEKDYIATRTAYQLNLKGPAISINTACSSSLVAVAQAVDAIRNGQCDMAIAGGISITVPIHSGQRYEEGAMFSRDGHTRTFDAQATGTVFSDGGGVVLLKDLDKAEADGDTIYAVIHGVGLSNDGGDKASFMAPSATGQAMAIRMAMEDAGFFPESIGYIETHGTATPLGDPIEIEGLKMAFGDTSQKQFCRIGSIKSNMGHLTHAAGVAGLIKVALSLHQKTLPASINFEQPNPNIDFQNSPFVVNDHTYSWEGGDRPFRAGVSSMGVGGTNAHIVLEEYKGEGNKQNRETTNLALINWSAKSETSLTLYADKLEGYIKQHPNTPLQDIAVTLQTTRQDFNHRSYITATDTDDLLKQLAAKNWQRNTLYETNTDVIFMFPGQGSQYVNMGKVLYEREQVYQDAIDACAELLLPNLGEDIRHIIFVADDPEKAAQNLRNTYYTQPALFVTEYALAKLWMSWGIQPTAFIGHSVGEFVAAHLSGILSLADALHLIFSRGKLISSLPGGGMLSIRQSANEIISSLPKELSIAAVNAPNLCVVAGENEIVKKYAEQLEKQGVKTSILQTSHAFHSNMMNPIVEQFKEIVKGVTLRTPQKPIASTVTGEWLSDEEATNPDYWASHIKATVRFSDALKFVHDELNPVLLEVGPGNVTATLAKQHHGIKVAKTIGGLDSSDDGVLEYSSIFDALGKLWLNRVSPNWKEINKELNAKIAVNLPTYAYNRKYYWVEAGSSTPIKRLDSELLSTTNNVTIQNNQAAPSIPTFSSPILHKMIEIMEDATGMDLDMVNLHLSFIELGLDSLLLTQIAFNLKKEFDLPITFRMISREYNTVPSLVDYINKNIKPESGHFFDIEAQQAPNLATSPVSSAKYNGHQNSEKKDIGVEQVLNELKLLSQQVAILQKAVSDLHINPSVNGKSTPVNPVEAPGKEKRTPPIPGARLGKNKSGNPAWFIENKEVSGKYVEIVL